MHGLGAFAIGPIPKGTRLIEYAGARITPAQADERYPDEPGVAHHTYLFAIDDDIVIERENLPDVELSVRDQTKVEQDGEQKNLRALREGDQVRAQFQVVDDDPVAVQISAQSSTQQPQTGRGGGGDAGTQ